jgi:chromosome segregation ATPase
MEDGIPDASILEGNNILTLFFMIAFLVINAGQVGLKRAEAKTVDMKVDTETQSVVNKLALQVMNIMERESVTQKELVEYRFKSKEDKNRLQRELDQRTKEQENLRKDVTALSNRIEELEKQVTILKRERDVARGERDEERAAKEAAMVEKARLEEEKQKLEARIQELEEEKKQLDNSIEELDETNVEKVSSGSVDVSYSADDLPADSSTGSN